MRKSDHYLNHKQEIQEELKKFKGKIPKVRIKKTPKEIAKEWSITRRKNKSGEQEKEKQLNLERMKRRGWII